MSATGPASLAHWLALAMQQGLERLDAQLLLLHSLGRSAHERAWLLTHDTDALPEQAQNLFETSVQRRMAGEPVAYITGIQEFYGLELRVDARVLIPRPDTETLVDWALEHLQNMPEASVLDLGTGSGAIALALKHSRPDLRVSALDTSVEALGVARANAKKLALDIEFLQGDWLTGSADMFDLIVSNPPYIAAQDRHLAQLRYEPQLALTSGEDGLDDIRTIVLQAAEHLKPEGWLMLEHGFDQASAVRQLLLDGTYSQVQSRQDLQGIERCSAGRVNPIA
jgi:release factor glutamine methyltransferase